MFKENLLKKALKLYAGEHVLNHVLKYGEDRLSLGAEKKDLTIYFQSVNGFTLINESISPEDLVLMLNEYLNTMTECIHSHNGVIDHYEGSLIMAIWGLEDQKGHPKDACKCALECVNHAEYLSVKWSNILPPLGVRIGINSGNVVLGNLGSKYRIHYTVMGDNVNIAARLEGANDHFKTQILISEYTKDQLNDEFKIKEVSTVNVVGKEDPVRLYTFEPENS